MNQGMIFQFQYDFSLRKFIAYSYEHKYLTNRTDVYLINKFEISVF